MAVSPKQNDLYFNACTVHLCIVFISTNYSTNIYQNLCLARHKFFKLLEDDTEMSKHVGVNII